MKKLIILSVFAIGFGMSLNAQSDSFFRYNNVEEQRTNDWGVAMPAMIGHGLESDQSAAPLGSGLLLLGGMAVLYARRKKSN